MIRVAATAVASQENSAAAVAVECGVKDPTYIRASKKKGKMRYIYMVF